MPTMTLRVDPYARTPAKLSKTGRVFALVLALHVGLVLLVQQLWRANLPEPVREVVTAALLPIFQDAPPSTSPPISPAIPLPVPPASKLINATPESVKTVPAPQPTPAMPSQATAPASQAPPALPAQPTITAALAAPAVVVPAPVTPAPVPAPSTIVQAKKTVQPTLVTGSCEMPRYPKISERLEEEGLVRLLLLISETGKVIESSVKESSGYKRLDDAALAALSLCTYKPGTIDGKPHTSWVSQPYKWKINRD